MGRVALTSCLLLLLAAACGGEDPPPHLAQDAGVTLPDAALDGRTAPDFFPIPADLPQPDAGCTLGTTSNCSFCGETCPPGKVTPSTAPVCLQGKCSIQCQGEYYDVNNDTKDGCEVQDDLPVHETESAAYDMGKVDDCDNSKSATGVIPSDGRKHLQAPVDRPNGRADWFKVHITDKFGCVVEAEVKVSLTGLPTSSSYRAVAHYVCDNNKKLSPDSKLGYGGAELSLAPGTGCTTLGDDSGTLYVKVSKESGPHSSAKFAVDIKP